MNVIFLDIDGVLNSEVWSQRMYDTEQYEEMKTMIDSEAVKKVINLCTEMDLKIVVSSSWRSWNVKDTINQMSENKNLAPLCPFIIGVTPGSMSCKRGEEIQKYMYLTKIDKYVIFDDDTDMLDEQQPNFVHTNYFYGLTDDDVEKAREILHR